MSKDLDTILNWQTSLIVRETIMQGISETHKIHVTNEMVDEARAKAEQSIKDLMLDIVGDSIPKSKNIRDVAYVKGNTEYWIGNTDGYNQAIDDIGQQLRQKIEEL